MLAASNVLSFFSSAGFLEHLTKSGTISPMGEKIWRKCGEQGPEREKSIGNW
jgi:hypothetical protein